LAAKSHKTEFFLHLFYSQQSEKVRDKIAFITYYPSQVNCCNKV